MTSATPTIDAYAAKLARKAARDTRRAERIEAREAQKAEVLARFIARKKAREDEAAAVAIERERALSCTARVPPAYQQFGVIQTRAWIVAAKRCRQFAQRQRVKSAELRELRKHVESVPRLSVAACADLIYSLETPGVPQP